VLSLSKQLYFSNWVSHHSRWSYYPSESCLLSVCGQTIPTCRLSCVCRFHPRNRAHFAHSAFLSPSVALVTCTGAAPFQHSAIRLAAVRTVNDPVRAFSIPDLLQRSPVSGPQPTPVRYIQRSTVRPVNHAGPRTAATHHERACTGEISAAGPRVLTS
jgi:hypothetical protein